METNTQPNSNVIQLNPRIALFNADLRGRMEKGISSQTEKPSEVVNEIEQIICTYLVAGVRRLATKAAEALGAKIGTL